MLFPLHGYSRARTFIFMTKTPLRTIAQNSNRSLEEVIDQYDGQISKYGDPIEGERTGLSAAEAHDVAREDAGLLYVETQGTTYAILDTDGTRLVVWGMGDSPESARADAADQDGYEETDHNKCVELSPRERNAVEAGTVAWSVLR